MAAIVSTSWSNTTYIPSFIKIDLAVEDEAKKIFKMVTGNIGFPIGMILTTFNLLVAKTLRTKFHQTDQAVSEDVI